jgi:hypothetical protein
MGRPARRPLPGRHGPYLERVHSCDRAGALGDFQDFDQIGFEEVGDGGIFRIRSHELFAAADAVGNKIVFTAAEEVADFASSCFGEFAAETDGDETDFGDVFVAIRTSQLESGEVEMVGDEIGDDLHDAGWIEAGELVGQHGRMFAWGGRGWWDGVFVAGDQVFEIAEELAELGVHNPKF